MQMRSGLIKCLVSLLYSKGKPTNVTGVPQIGRSLSELEEHPSC